MAYKTIDVKCPVLKNGVHYLTSDYASRNKSRSTHSGMDMIGKRQACDYIIAIADGKVVTSEYNQYFGYYVRIQHKNGMYSVYYHMQKGSVKVKVGDSVTKGQVIGYMGSTGYSTGAHLHFGVYTNITTHVDPLPYLKGEKNFETSPKSTYPGTYPTLPQRGFFCYDTKHKKVLDRGEQVKNLQRLLNWTLDGNLVIDGALGPLCDKVILQFQKTYGLSQDGCFGKACLAKAKTIEK